MVKRIRLAVMDGDGDPEGEFEDVTLHMDAELYNISKGLQRTRDPRQLLSSQLADAAVANTLNDSILWLRFNCSLQKILCDHEGAVIAN